jgi:hypothetical protein
VSSKLIEGEKKLIELKKFLVDKGYKLYDNPYRTYGDRCDWMAAKRIVSKGFENYEQAVGNKLQIGVTPTFFQIKGDMLFSINMDIKFSISDIWYNLEAYSLSIDKVISKHDEISDKLIVMLNSVIGETYNVDI